MPSSPIYKKPPLKIIVLYTEILSSCHVLVAKGLCEDAEGLPPKPALLRFFHPSLETSPAGCAVPAALATSFILGQVPRNPVKTWTARIQEVAPSGFGTDAPDTVDIV